jgi:hypothetical protein
MQTNRQNWPKMKLIINFNNGFSQNNMDEEVKAS